MSSNNYPDIINKMRNFKPSLVVDDTDIRTKFNDTIIDIHNLGFVKLPMIERAIFEKEDIGDFKPINNPEIEINRFYLEGLKLVDIKKEAKKVGIHDLTKGKPILIEKILDKIEIIKNYKTM